MEPRKNADEVFLEPRKNADEVFLTGLWTVFGFVSHLVSLVCLASLAKRQCL